MPTKKQPVEATENTIPPVLPSCYYVWNDKGDYVQSFHEDQYKGEALRYAKELADRHDGWTIS